MDDNAILSMPIVKIVLTKFLTCNWGPFSEQLGEGVSGQFLDFCLAFGAVDPLVPADSVAPHSFLVLCHGQNTVQEPMSW